MTEDTKTEATVTPIKPGIEKPEWREHDGVYAVDLTRFAKQVGLDVEVRGLISRDATAYRARLIWHGKVVHDSEHAMAQESVTEVLKACDRAIQIRWTPR